MGKVSELVCYGMWPNPNKIAVTDPSYVVLPGHPITSQLLEIKKELAKRYIICEMYYCPKCGSLIGLVVGEGQFVRDHGQS